MTARTARRRILSLILGGALLLSAPGAVGEGTDDAIQIVEPTCTEVGYTLFTDDETGVVTTLDVTEALGHALVRQAEDGQTKYVCQRCGYTELVEQKEPARIELTGSLEGIGKKEIVALPVHFSGEGQEFDCWARLSLQGHSTIDLEKPNFTMRLTDDAEGRDKHKVAFGAWQREHKYILKANMDDETVCRNLIGANVWADMAATRENVDAHLLATSNNGAVDGFPATVWLNGEFLGLYTMNLHKDNDLYQIKTGDPAAVMIANRQTKDESLFRAESVFDEYNYDWEIEVCTTDDCEWVKTNFNRLIRFVMDADDETFRTELGSYLDVPAAIDYLVFIQALGLRDNSAKDLVLITYDKGEHWIPTVYDMDDAFTDPCIPYRENGVWYTGTGSLLWDRVLNLYHDAAAARYRTLRRTVLSEGSLSGRVNDFIDAIPARYYEMDLARYPGRNAGGQAQILDFIRTNLAQLDAIYGED